MSSSASSSSSSSFGERKIVARQRRSTSSGREAIQQTEMSSLSSTSSPSNTTHETFGAGRMSSNSSPAVQMRTALSSSSSSSSSVSMSSDEVKSSKRESPLDLEDLLEQAESSASELQDLMPPLTVLDPRDPAFPSALQKSLRIQANFFLRTLSLTKTACAQMVSAVQHTNERLNTFLDRQAASHAPQASQAMQVQESKEETVVEISLDDYMEHLELRQLVAFMCRVGLDTTQTIRCLFTFAFADPEVHTADTHVTILSQALLPIITLFNNEFKTPLTAKFVSKVSKSITTLLEPLPLTGPLQVALHGFPYVIHPSETHFAVPTKKLCRLFRLESELEAKGQGVLTRAMPSFEAMLDIKDGQVRLSRRNAARVVALVLKVDPVPSTPEELAHMMLQRSPLLSASEGISMLNTLRVFGLECSVAFLNSAPVRTGVALMLEALASTEDPELITHYDDGWLPLDIGVQAAVNVLAEGAALSKEEFVRKFQLPFLQVAPPLYHQAFAEVKHVDAPTNAPDDNAPATATAAADAADVEDDNVNPPNTNPQVAVGAVEEKAGADAVVLEERAAIRTNPSVEEKAAAPGRGRVVVVSDDDDDDDEEYHEEDGDEEDEDEGEEEDMDEGYEPVKPKRGRPVKDQENKEKEDQPMKRKRGRPPGKGKGATKRTKR